VATRIRTYALPVPANVGAYVDRLFALQGVQAWVRGALAEHDFVPFDEPYRTQT
jgi:glutathione S-transferase